MKIKLRILKKGNDYHVQRYYFFVWITQQICWSEFAAKKELDAVARRISESAAAKRANKITKVVEVLDVDV